MKTEFKEGDRVINRRYDYGTVMNVRDSDSYYVKFDNILTTKLIGVDYLKHIVDEHNVNQTKNKQTIVYKQCEFKNRQLLICICYEHYFSQVYVGYSVCNTEDVFNKELGEKIALGRALKKSLYFDKDMSMSNFLGKSKQLLEQIADKVIFDIQNEIITIKGINK